MEYRGFTIERRGGRWYALAGSGVLQLGPFRTEAAARAAVDAELAWEGP